MDVSEKRSKNKFRKGIKMMTIGSITGVNSSTQAGISNRNAQEDAVSKSIKKQIENAQKQLQELSSNKELSEEEKMKKRQEIQKEIASLTQELKRHQIEQRMQRQSGESMDDLVGGARKKNATKARKQGSGLSQSSMRAMISAETSMKQAQVQGSMATQMEGRASVLESEIKQDAGRGISSEQKEEELAKVQQKAQSATESQMSALSDANQSMKEAAKTEQEEKAENENDHTEKVSKKTNRATQTVKDSNLTESSVLTKKAEDTTKTTLEEEKPNDYVSVDIRL